MELIEYIKRIIASIIAEKPSKIDESLLKFDRDISNVITMCVQLKREFKILKAEMSEVGNSYSAKLLSNEKIDLFVKRYSDIVICYDSACKEFSQADPILEKVMFSEENVQLLAHDVAALFDEIKASQSFTSTFEGAVSYIFETLSPTLDRILEVCSALKDKIKESLPSYSSKLL